MFVFSMFGDVLNVRFMTRLLNVILIGILSYSCCAAAAPPLYVASKDGVEITISGVFHSSISEAGPPPNGLTDAVATAGAIAVEFDVSSRFAGDRARDVMRQFRIKAVDLLRPDQIESAKDKIYGIMGRRDVAERMLSSPPCLLIEMLMAWNPVSRFSIQPGFGYEELVLGMARERGLPVVELEPHGPEAECAVDVNSFAPLLNSRLNVLDDRANAAKHADARYALSVNVLSGHRNLQYAENDAFILIGNHEDASTYLGILRKRTSAMGRELLKFISENPETKRIVVLIGLSHVEDSVGILDFLRANGYELREI